MKKKRKAARPQSLAQAPEIMDIKTLARYLGMGRSKIYGLIRQRKIPASRIGRQYRFSKPIVDAWLRERLIMQPADTDLPLFDKPRR
jgi:excisionase family DNA binding protein